MHQQKIIPYVHLILKCYKITRRIKLLGGGLARYSGDLKQGWGTGGVWSRWNGLKVGGLAGKLIN